MNAAVLVGYIWPRYSKDSFQKKNERMTSYIAKVMAAYSGRTSSTNNEIDYALRRVELINLDTGVNIMKKEKFLIWSILLIAIMGYFAKSIPEPDRCSMCADISRHALCIINLSTGEKLELDIYEPHPFLVGEIAEEQPGGYFSFIRGAGVEGYKVGAEYIVVSVPIKSGKINQRYFCNSCRKLLENERKSSFVLVDLKCPEKPAVYSVNEEVSLYIRCYSVLVEEDIDKQKYEITITGHYEK